MNAHGKMDLTSESRPGFLVSIMSPCPNHAPLRLGTFKSILKLVASHHSLSIEELSSTKQRTDRSSGVGMQTHSVSFVNSVENC